MCLFAIRTFNIKFETCCTTFNIINKGVRQVVFKTHSYYMCRLLKAWPTEVRFEWYPLYRQFVLPVKIDYHKILIIPTQNGTIFRELLANTDGPVTKNIGYDYYRIEQDVQTSNGIGMESSPTRINNPLL